MALWEKYEIVIINNLNEKVKNLTLSVYAQISNEFLKLFLIL
jgi:hypothetical protein